MLWTLITHGLTAVVCGGLGWWIGRKGGMAVAGDIRIAAQDISKKV